MRAFPVNLVAARTAIKLAVVAARKRLQPGPDLLPLDAFDFPVAGQATPQGLYLRSQVESSHDFHKLGVGIIRTHPVTVRDSLAKQQAPIARQYDSLLARGDIDNFGILQRIAVSAVESQHAQTPCELAEVDVDHKSGNAQGSGAQVLQRRDIQALEYRVHGNPIAVFQSVIEAHRLVVNHDQINFAMRHSEPFDRILNRGPAVKSILDSSFITAGIEEIVELLVKTKIGDVGFHAYNRFPEC